MNIMDILKLDIEPLEDEESLAYGATLAAVDTGAMEKRDCPAVSEVKDESITVLLVDDDSNDRQIISYLISQADESILVRQAEDITLAYEKVSDGKVDVVLLDYLLPEGVRGPEHIEELRDLAGNQYLPVIVLTGYGDEEMAASAFKDGAADYMSKKSLSAAALQRAIDNSVTKARLERKLAQQREEVVRKNAVLRKRNHEIQSFYQTVSHELKSPLTGARENASVVLDGIVGSLNPQQEECLQTVVQCCDNLASLIDDLLNTAAAENGKLSVNFEPCDLALLAERTLARHRSAAKEKSVDLKLLVASELPEVSLDKLRITQLLSNLIGNAVKFLNGPGQVCVSLSHDAATSSTRIEVIDNGPGISADEQTQVFDKFYQSDKPETRSRGMGLGLYLCRKIVELHRGELVLESALGEGATFRIILPKLNTPRSNNSGIANND